jgi:phosphoribosylanthranilate isomerase
MFPPSLKPRVKICCITTAGEAALAVRHGAAALGFVSAMPSGPGVIDEQSIAAIVARVPPGIGTFLLTARQEVGAIVAQQRRTGVNTLQICDRLEPGGLAELRTALPGIGLVQVVHVVGEESVAEAIAVAPEADGLLLDSGDPRGVVKELGGTGRTHDWALSRRIVEAVSVPVYLAGGLHDGNVAAAIAVVAPFGVDVCTGVRGPAGLAEEKLAAFMRATG